MIHFTAQKKNQERYYSNTDEGLNYSKEVCHIFLKYQLILKVTILLQFLKSSHNNNKHIPVKFPGSKKDQEHSRQNCNPPG